ncbi:hypothetical protein CIPAW_07G160400 [Carya illinoinensis]|uniref:Uncharacterized protein n=1 Tax=Carya illinoinensis TaxID=32201 RepID=A0A8T1Q3K5_CARIL|nr:hypothetical protein CIPAW_07G160400 [Carya illinoinensis]
MPERKEVPMIENLNVPYIGLKYSALWYRPV